MKEGNLIGILVSGGLFLALVYYIYNEIQSSSKAKRFIDSVEKRFSGKMNEEEDRIEMHYLVPFSIEKMSFGLKFKTQNLVISIPVISEESAIGEFYPRIEISKKSLWSYFREDLIKHPVHLKIHSELSKDMTRNMISTNFSRELSQLWYNYHLEGSIMFIIDDKNSLVRIDYIESFGGNITVDFVEKLIELIKKQFNLKTDF